MCFLKDFAIPAGSGSISQILKQRPGVTLCRAPAACTHAPGPHPAALESGADAVISVAHLRPARIKRLVKARALVSSSRGPDLWEALMVRRGAGVGAQTGCCARPSPLWAEITGIWELSCSHQKKPLGLALAVAGAFVALPATPGCCCTRQ